ncbi:hypothetical protein [Streptomyces sp. OE57]|uniref:hypothetical protein n=1 Tax=Streptomyces lacaronensis TaxID=3379885 RepID=UPI0039B77140
MLPRPHSPHARGPSASLYQPGLDRICDLLDQELRQFASGGGKRFRIRAGRGGLDQTAGLLAGEIDLAVVTPTSALRLLHQFGDLQELSGLGVIPRPGSLVVTTDAALPVGAVTDLATCGRRVTVATGADDGVSLLGFAAHRALRLAGVGTAHVDFVYDEHPWARFAEGQADVVIHDSMWQSPASTRPVKYLAWGERVLHAFNRQGWATHTLHRGQLPGLHEDLGALDFSDFAVLCRADLDDEIARRTAWFLLRQHALTEAELTPLPLHPGAARAYAAFTSDNAPTEIR